MGRRNQRGGATPATTALERAGLSYTLHSYVHDPAETDFGDEAARELGVAAELILKTLLVDLDGELVVGVIPVSARLDVKALAAVLGGKRAALADPSLAERKTGYVVGGISPIGQRTRLRTVVDASVAEVAAVWVSGGRRGLDIELSPAHLLAATGAVWGRITRETREIPE